MDIQHLLAKAKADQPVFITEVDNFFKTLPEKTRLRLELEQLDGSTRTFVLELPADQAPDADALELLRSYIHARVYNILSSLGGRSLHLFFDASFNWLQTLADDLNNVFGIDRSRSQREGYGRCINVIDRMLEHIDRHGSASRFAFILHPTGGSNATDPVHGQTNGSTKDTVNIGKATEPQASSAITRFRQAAVDLDDKILCGIDVGGTDIKIAAAVDGSIHCFKEYDWFPAEFTVSDQLIDPILLLVRLVRAQLSVLNGPVQSIRMPLESTLAIALDKSCSLDRIGEIVEEAEMQLHGHLISFDAIGLCFPDVVVKNKIVGGEVYKTRGIRNNPQVDYEEEFARLTDLDDRLRPFCKPNGRVRMTNDGPMASFTAAVEQVFSQQPERVADGVFAHTLGTELGTGWIDQSGSIPDIPLEVYNFIIDLGSDSARQYHCDDPRSIINFNTGLSGTLQKYASQSGAFRLAIKYFRQSRPDLYQELLDKGFIRENGTQSDSLGQSTGSGTDADRLAVQTESGDAYPTMVVPTEPVDMRKPFLQHLMDLTTREQDAVCDQIFIDIGQFMAVTWAECEQILMPQAKTRVLFGRLVKNPRCFELMQEGARMLYPDLVFEAADDSIANTSLMRQLESDPDYTIAQFAQAVGAIYFGNME